MIVNVLAGLLAIVLSTGGAPPPEPTVEEPVRVLSSEAEVRFPDEIEFRVTAESEDRITGIRLHYRFVNLSTTSYAYPDFRESSRVNASYRLQTRGSSYVPAGATIEYYYEFTDASGRRSRTEPALVEYLDPRYEWRSVRTDNLLVVYHDRSEQNVLTAARTVDRRLAGLKQLLGLKSTRPVKAVILGGRQEARRTFPFVSQTARDSHLFGGFAYGGVRPVPAGRTRSGRDDARGGPRHGPRGAALSLSEDAGVAQRRSGDVLRARRPTQ